MRTGAGTFRPVLLLDTFLQAGYAAGASAEACGSGRMSRADATSLPCFRLSSSAAVSPAVVDFNALSIASMQRKEVMYLAMTEGLTVVVRLRVDAAAVPAQPAPLLQLWTARRVASVLTLSWVSSAQQLRLSWRDANGEEQLALHSGTLQLTNLTTVAFRLGTQPPRYQVHVNGKVKLDSRDEVRACQRHVLPLHPHVL